MTVDGMLKGGLTRYRTRTHVTRDCDTAGLPIPLHNATHPSPLRSPTEREGSSWTQGPSTPPYRPPPLPNRVRGLGFDPKPIHLDPQRPIQAHPGPSAT